MSAIIGVGISASAQDDPVSEAITAEALGYDFVSASDHPASANTHEVTSLLTWVAARTSRIRVATRVLGVPFRRPAMVAKAAESLHLLSGGRLILGLGAGHSDDEIRALGGPDLTPGQKVAGLADAVTIIRAEWTGAACTHLPIWLGTYGRKALALTGAVADGWIPSLGFASPRQIPDMLNRIRDASVAAERPLDAVRAIYNVSMHVDPRARRSENVITGSAADVLEQLKTLGGLGFSGFNVVPAHPRDVRVFAEEVLPGLRAETPA